MSSCLNIYYIADYSTLGQYVVLEQLQEGDDYVIRYAIRNINQVFDPHFRAISSRHPHNLRQEDLHQQTHQQIASSHAAGLTYSHNATIFSTKASNNQQDLEIYDTQLYNYVSAPNLLHMHQDYHTDHRSDILSNVHTLHALGTMDFDFNKRNIPSVVYGTASSSFSKSSSHVRTTQASTSASQCLHAQDRGDTPPVHAHVIEDGGSAPTAAPTYLTDISSMSRGKGVEIQRIAYH